MTRVSRRSCDASGRWRSTTVSFRVSPEEAAFIDAEVAMSGLSKQEFIVGRLLDRRLTVIPSSRVQRNLSLLMDSVYRELRRIGRAPDMSPELEETVVLLSCVFAALGIQEGPSDVSTEREAIRRLARAVEGGRE